LKKGLGYILGNFFPQASSGHPEIGPRETFRREEKRV
jgi:hypothetical protein